MEQSRRLNRKCRSGAEGTMYAVPGAFGGPHAFVPRLLAGARGPAGRQRTYGTGWRQAEKKLVCSRPHPTPTSSGVSSRSRIRAGNPRGGPSARQAPGGRAVPGSGPQGSWRRACLAGRAKTGGPFRTPSDRCRIFPGPVVLRRPSSIKATVGARERGRGVIPMCGTGPLRADALVDRRLQPCCSSRDGGGRDQTTHRQDVGEERPPRINRCAGRRGRRPAGGECASACPAVHWRESAPDGRTRREFYATQGQRDRGAPARKGVSPGWSPRPNPFKPPTESRFSHPHLHAAYHEGPLVPTAAAAEPTPHPARPRSSRRSAGAQPQRARVTRFCTAAGAGPFTRPPIGVSWAGASGSTRWGLSGFSGSPTRANVPTACC